MELLAILAWNRDSEMQSEMEIRNVSAYLSGKSCSPRINTWIENEAFVLACIDPEKRLVMLSCKGKEQILAQRI